jgi:hypothetical protein
MFAVASLLALANLFAVANSLTPDLPQLFSNPHAYLPSPTPKNKRHNPRKGHALKDSCQFSVISQQLSVNSSQHIASDLQPLLLLNKINTTPNQFNYLQTRKLRFALP